MSAARRVLAFFTAPMVKKSFPVIDCGAIATIDRSTTGSLSTIDRREIGQEAKIDRTRMGGIATISGCR